MSAPLANTPLMNAAAKASLADIKRLLKQGADVHVQNELGCTALACLVQEALKHSSKKVASCLDALVKAGADVNSADCRGRTPVWVATQMGAAGLLDLLLKHGGDPTIADASGVFPIDIASFAVRFSDDVRMDAEVDEIEFTRSDEAQTPNLKQAALATTRNEVYRLLRLKHERTPQRGKSNLEFAKANGFVSIVRILENPRLIYWLNKKIDIQNRRGDGRVSRGVVCAARRLHLEAVKQEFVRDPEDLDVVCEETGHTPLTACITGWPGEVWARKSMAAFLLALMPSLAAEPNAQTNLTPLDYLETCDLESAERKDLVTIVSAFVTNPPTHE